MLGSGRIVRVVRGVVRVVRVRKGCQVAGGARCSPAATTKKNLALGVEGLGALGF